MHNELDSGFYQLVIVLRKRRDISVGHHGRFSFPPGYYVYTGSAKRGLESRIARHMRKRKKMRWHVDYLLRHGRILAVKRHGESQSECELNSKVEGLPGSRVIVPGFGSSDCKCPTHLLYFERSPLRTLNMDSSGITFDRSTRPSGGQLWGRASRGLRCRGPRTSGGSLRQSDGASPSP